MRKIICSLLSENSDGCIREYDMDDVKLQVADTTRSTKQKLIATTFFYSERLLTIILTQRRRKIMSESYTTATTVSRNRKNVTDGTLF